MHNITKIILKLCFGIWLITSILPETVLSDYPIIRLLFQSSIYLSALIFVLALIAFIIPLFPQKKPMAIDDEKTRLILHDLDTETANSLFRDFQNTRIFSARKKMARC